MDRVLKTYLSPALDDNYLSKNNASTQVLYLNKRILSDFFQNENCCLQVRIIDYDIRTSGEITTYRLVTSLMDIVTFPALLLAEQYHQRWEIENTIDELKTHLLGRKTPIRSLNPREVVQEIYGWLIGQLSAL